jgi:hypothetical protein
MARTKASGIDPFAGTRVVRRGVIQAGAISRGGLLDQERHRVSADALGQLQELASTGEDVRDLSPQAYRARKRLALRLGRQAFNPRP